MLILLFFAIFSGAIATTSVQLEPSSQTVPLGRNAEFYCVYEGTDIPFWSINGRHYSTISLAEEEKYSYSNGTLTIRAADDSDDNTEVQCVFSNPESNIGTLFVTDGMSGGQRASTSNHISLHYHSVTRNRNGYEVSWELIRQMDDCGRYRIEPYTLDEIRNQNGIIYTQNTANLSSSEMVYYRITAIDMDGVTCSDIDSLQKYYGFMFNETQTASFGECLPLPEDAGNNLRITWPNPSTSRSVICLIREREVRCPNEVLLNAGYNISVCGIQNNSVRFTSSADDDEILVSFLHRQELCDKDCNIDTIISSFRLIGTIEDVTTQDITTEDVTTEDVTTEDVTTEDVTTEDVTTATEDATTTATEDDTTTEIATATTPNTCSSSFFPPSFTIIITIYILGIFFV